MKKVHLIQRLGLVANQQRSKGMKTFADFFARWLSEFDLSHHERFDFSHIDHFVPDLIMMAVEDLRHGKVEWIVAVREAYEKEVGSPFPNLIEVGESSLLDQSFVTGSIGQLLKDVFEADDWNHPKWEAYASCERQMLQVTFDKFLRLVYCRGLFDLLQKSQCSMAGTFGETELRVGSCAGRRMFTFARSIPGDTVYLDDAGKETFRTPSELSITFIAEDDDPLCLSAGLQSVRANIAESLAMMTDVINNWASDAKKQKKQFVTNANIGIGL